MDPREHFLEAAGICDTRGRWEYIEVYQSSCKLPPNMVVEAAPDGSNGFFHFHSQWELQSTSVKASTNFNGRKSTSIYFNESYHCSKSTSNSMGIGGSFYESKFFFINFFGNVHGSTSKTGSDVVAPTYR